MLDQTARARLTGWGRQVLRFVLPVNCTACGVPLKSDPVPFFCRGCWERIVPLQGPSCARCGQPFASEAATSHTPDHQCQNCIERPPAYERAWTLYPYLPPLQDAICAFKYNGKYGLAKPLGRLMIQAIPAQFQVDFIIPVPLHPARLRAREYNQSLLFADQVGCYLGKPVVATNLVRVLATDPQTTLSRQERLRNLRHAFAVRQPEGVRGRRILLIDDVFTTGTTLNECAISLKKAGAASVIALTLARTIDSYLVPDRILAERSPQTLPALGF